MSDQLALGEFTIVKKKLFGIFGAGGCGRGVMPVACEQYAQEDIELVFVDDKLAGSQCNGHLVIDFNTFTKFEGVDKRIAVAISDSKVRSQVVARCKDADLPFFQIRASQSVLMNYSNIGEGALISPFVTITSNVVIGHYFHANLYAYIEHDCIVGDFVTFAPAAKCNGNVHIGDGVYVGSGAVIKNGNSDRPLVIGAGAIIGMGAVVVKDVAPGVTVVGNPARAIKRR